MILMYYVYQKGNGLFSLIFTRGMVVRALLILLFSMFSMYAGSCAGRNTIEVMDFVSVSLNGFPVTELPATEIQQLPMTTVMYLNESAVGPSLLSVLSSCGISQFKDVTIRGYTKNRSAVDLDLEEIEVKKGMILYQNINGTASLFGPGVPEADQNMNVTELIVMPADCCVAG